MAGLKTLAKELQSKGRYGDTILAHINPQEAGILKALGGSGTRNPDTGLPEYWGGLGRFNPFNPGSDAGKAVRQIPGVKQAQDVATKIFQPAEKAFVQPVSRGLADFDKQVAKTIPGGWSTLGSVALAYTGAPLALQVGYGAARGGGLLRTGSSLQRTNLQGAVIGGATAYAQAKLGEYMRGAVPPGAENAVDTGAYMLPDAAPELLNTVEPTSIIPSGIDAGYFDVPPTAISAPPVPMEYVPQMDYSPYVPQEAANPFAGYTDVPPAIAPPPPTEQLVQLAGPGTTGYQPASVMDYLKSGEVGGALKQVGSNIYDSGANALQNVQDFGKAAITPETYTEGIPKALDKAMTNAGQTTSGIKNLVGLGDISSSEAAKLAAKTGINPMTMAGMTLYGETSLAALDEQRKYLEEAKRQNAISQAEYDKALGEINRQRDYADKIVRENPFNPNPNRDVSIGETYYGRSGEGENLYDRMQSNLYAMGGQVDDELGGDYSAMGMDQGNLQKGLFGLGYAEGGTPRFLSGGGDGMSDSIKATINEKQPARLADGEFVIPADVVSHLGNGSSKAGAKQLYAMMDRVRSARTGRKSQGKQINPRKYMTA